MYSLHKSYKIANSHAVGGRIYAKIKVIASFFVYIKQSFVSILFEKTAFLELFFEVHGMCEKGKLVFADKLCICIAVCHMYASLLSLQPRCISSSRGSYEREKQHNPSVWLGIFRKNIRTNK